MTTGKAWTVEKLGNLASIKTGSKNNQDKNPDGRYPFFVRSEDIERIDTYSYTDPAILIPGEGNIGEIVHFVNEPHEVHQRVYRISNFDSKVNPTFIYWYLKRFFKAHTEKYTVKATVDSLRLPTFQEFEINFPLLTEQNLIAEALIDIDELITVLKSEIDKKRNLRVACAQDLLTPKSSKKIKLGSYAKFSKGSGLPKSKLKENGKFKAIHYGELFLKYPETIKEVISRTDSNSQSEFSKANDVLMPSSDVTPSGLAVASCIKENDVLLGGDVLIIRPNSPQELNGSFLSYTIRNSKQEILKLVKGTTVYHIYGKDLAEFEFDLPSIEKQVEIVETLDQLLEELILLEHNLNKYECLKQAMMNDLLTGKVRLV